MSEEEPTIQAGDARRKQLFPPVILFAIAILNTALVVFAETREALEKYIKAPRPRKAGSPRLAPEAIHPAERAPAPAARRGRGDVRARGRPHEAHHPLPA
jgi:hypothetical protein